ncbi:protein CTLA-2-alpha [Diabrotica virgifera virgifera]|uniref:Protein CTLA-2-alpha-like n=1 Tax=Diabrotica virgifera virgifera TaxID=50390 RepID=A0A6P7FDP1_DIAVI|nr:protein CTLA-2-alpha [Diabrotica virgifera virgifera]
MFSKVFVLALIVAVAVASQTAEEAWPKYKTDYNRNYDAQEDATRFAIFKTNYDQIEAHNKKFEAGEVTWSMGLNQFADRTPEELKHLHGLRRPVGGSGVH